MEVSWPLSHHSFVLKQKQFHKHAVHFMDETLDEVIRVELLYFYPDGDQNRATNGVKIAY